MKHKDYESLLKKNSKKFLTSNNYKDRTNYELKNEKELGMIKNTGHGDLFICGTHNVYWASSPEIGKKGSTLFVISATVEWSKTIKIC